MTLAICSTTSFAANLFFAAIILSVMTETVTAGWCKPNNSVIILELQKLAENNYTLHKPAIDLLDHKISRSAWSFLWLFGQHFDSSLSYLWMKYHWAKSVHLAACYLFFIYLGQQWMKRREKLDLRIPLVCWNVCLAIYSIIGFLRLFPGFVSLLYTQGVAHTVCVRGLDDNPRGYWIWLFALSKVLELGDTVFIILRKQKLIFLHWYHHISVLIFTWHACFVGVGPGKCFVVMNYAVHSVMYLYYALRALRVYMPRYVPMSITCMQVVQMFLGAGIGLVAYSVKRQGQWCDQTDESMIFTLVLYGSYFVLFGHFFVKSYFSSEGKFVKPVEKKEN